MVKYFTLKYYRADVRGRKYVFGPSQAHFSPSRGQGLKFILTRSINKCQRTVKKTWQDAARGSLQWNSSIQYREV